MTLDEIMEKARAYAAYRRDLEGVQDEIRAEARQGRHGKRPATAQTPHRRADGGP